MLVTTRQLTAAKARYSKALALRNVHRRQLTKAEQELTDATDALLALLSEYR